MQLVIAPSSIAQWAGAAATFLAVLVALFREPFERWRRRPKFVVRIEPRPPDCVLSTHTDKAGGGPTAVVKRYWLRLWIENSGKTRAEQVQVFASAVLRKTARGEFAEVPDFRPMNLRWSNARDWNNPEVFAEGISPQLGKHCDLFCISDPHSQTVLRGHEGKSIAELQLEVFPTGNQHCLSPGEYKVKLLVGAANADPDSVTVLLNLTGGWSDELSKMFDEHVGINMNSSE